MRSPSAETRDVKVSLPIRGDLFSAVLNVCFFWHFGYRIARRFAGFECDATARTRQCGAPATLGRSWSLTSGRWVS